MERAAILLVAVLLVVLVFAPPPATTRRHRIDLHVMTPDGPVHGASIIEVRYARAPWWYPVGTGNRNGAGMVGEAPVVDLGQNRYLVMALEAPGGPSLLSSFADPAAGGNGFKPSWPPPLLAFTDIRDANSVRRADPDHLAATFGPGYRLLGMTATSTDAGPTSGTLAARFPALYRQVHDQPPFDRLTAIGAQDAPRDDPRWLSWRAFEAP